MNFSPMSSLIFAGMINLPFASKECSYSPINTFSHLTNIFTPLCTTSLHLNKFYYRIFKKSSTFFIFFEKFFIFLLRMKTVFHRNDKNSLIHTEKKPLFSPKQRLFYFSFPFFFLIFSLTLPLPYLIFLYFFLFY